VILCPPLELFHELLGRPAVVANQEELRIAFRQHELGELGSEPGRPVAEELVRLGVDHDRLNVAQRRRNGEPRPPDRELIFVACNSPP